MLSDAAKILLASKVLRRKYTGDKLTSGALETGKIYRIDKFVTGDDFSNVGADSDSDAAGASRRIFTATGNNPSSWANLSVLRELKVADLKAYAETVFKSASRTVTITSGGFEGGSGSGETTFETALLSIAIEDLLSEFDPEYDEAAGQGDGVVVEFGP